MASEEVVTKTDVANWTEIEDASEDVKRYTTQVKNKVAEILVKWPKKLKKFDAVSFRSGTPGGTGSVWYAVKVDIGEGDAKFIHVMLSAPVIENPSPQFERLALHFTKDAPVEPF
ncbi:uncharacterized protein [Amphiura filiformis]|uniref:uncharacterized protein n=1 Tax=Amphiura filiformis TaxID=82378 RepID=UPI003B2210DF